MYKMRKISAYKPILDIEEANRHKERCLNRYTASTLFCVIFAFICIITFSFLFPKLEERPDPTAECNKLFRTLDPCSSLFFVNCSISSEDICCTTKNELVCKIINRTEPDAVLCHDATSYINDTLEAFEKRYPVLLALTIIFGILGLCGACTFIISLICVYVQSRGIDRLRDNEGVNYST